MGLVGKQLGFDLWDGATGAGHASGPGVLQINPEEGIPPFKRVKGKKDPFMAFAGLVGDGVRRGGGEEEAGTNIGLIVENSFSAKGMASHRNGCPSHQTARE